MIVLIAYVLINEMLRVTSMFHRIQRQGYCFLNDLCIDQQDWTGYTILPKKKKKIIDDM